MTAVKSPTVMSDRELMRHRYSFQRFNFGMTFAHEDVRTFLQCDTVTVMVEAAWSGRSYNVLRSDHGVVKLPEISPVVKALDSQQGS